MLSSVRSSRVLPKESTYLSTLRFLSVSWAELKLDTMRVAIPKHLRTAGQRPGGFRDRWDPEESPLPPVWSCSSLLCFGRGQGRDARLLS